MLGTPTITLWVMANARCTQSSTKVGLVSLLGAKLSST
ncbi:Uncharacterised protein [Vibrio cholerae]|nr:Uncharacterised protein [Vibrio cholerae]